MENTRNKYLMYLGVIIALLPVLIFRDYTPSNELRYLSIADEALQNHTFFSFSNHGLPYADKPPLYLWIVMLCKVVCGKHCMWLLSLFSLIPALVTVNIMDGWASSEIKDEKTRTAGRLMLITSAMFVGTAVVLRMDMLMCMFIVLALRSFWRMSTGEDTSGKEKWLFPVYVFLAIFSKGPVGFIAPLIVPLVWLIVKGRVREFGRYWGWRTWLVLAVLCGLWFLAAGLEGGKEYLNNLLFHQTVDRAVNAFHHKEPFYYYFIAIWYCIAPWSLLVAGIIIAQLRKGDARSDLQTFFITTALTILVMMSCFSSKLSVYLLPSFPFFVYAAVLSLRNYRRIRWAAVLAGIPMLIFVFALPGLIFATRQESMAYMHQGLFYSAATVLSGGGICGLYILFSRRRDLTNAIVTFSVFFLVAAFVGGWDTKKINDQIGYGPLCEKAMEISGESGVETYCTWHVKRSENMDVYLHSPVQIIDDSVEPEDFPRPCVLMVKSKYIKDIPDVEAEMVGPYAVILLQ